MKKIIAALLLFSVVSAAFAVTLMQGVSNFRDQPYWSGKAKMVKTDGKNILELTATTKNGRTFGRAFAIYGTKENFLPGAEIVAVAKVRGKGKFYAGILKYLPAVGAPLTVTGEPVELTDDYQELKFKYPLEAFYDRIYPFLQVQGEGVAYVESFRLEKMIDDSVKIQVNTPMQVIAADAKANAVEFKTSCKNSDINIVKFNVKNPAISKIKSDKNGKIIIPADKYPLGTNHVYAAFKGVGARSFVEVVSNDEFKKTDAYARQINLKKPIKLLVLGDSLSDFYRGYNYIDRLAFWINKYNKGKFTFHNAGVGGDFLERASNRMEKELGYSSKWVYRSEMYKGIFKDEYDYVFIFMGQNDTRCMPSTKYEIPETTVEEQQKYLSLMLKRLKEKCPKAKVVLISPSPSNEALFDSYIAKGRKLAFYGKKKFVDAYDEYNRKFCKENNLDYINITAPMRNYKVLKDLYVSDGVHLSSKGGNLIADEILKYFAGEF